MTAYFVEYSVPEASSRADLEAAIGRLRYRAPMGTVEHSGKGFRLHVGVDRRRRRNHGEVQPSVARNGALTVFDGFLVERGALVDKLIARRCAVSQDLPDVDLVSACYETFGQSTPSHLSGDFSFVILDPRNGSLLASRDPFGRRALFYARCGDCWVFSNELPAVLEHPDCHQAYSKEALGDFLMFGWHDLYDKSLTAFRSVRSVVPGCYISVSGTSFQEVRYWRFPEARVAPRGRRDKGYVDELCFHLKRAVADRVDCSTVIVSMSGGLDSTAVAALAKASTVSADASARIVLETNVHEHGADEESYARMAAAHLGLPHRIRVHSLDAVFDPWPPTWSPHRQIAPISILDHDRQLAGDAQIRMVGSAADSLFAHDVATFLGTARTYGLRAAWTSRRELKRMFGASMSWGTGVLARRLTLGASRKPRFDPVWKFPGWLQPDFVREHSLRERWEDFWNWTPEVTRNQPHPSIERWLGWPSWFCGNMFVGIDFCPAEVVDPFFDLGLLDFVMSIPSEPWLRDKRLFREAVAHLLPPALVRRPKVIAGDVFGDPLARVPGAIVNEWTAEPALSEYVVRSAVPAFAADVDPAERLVQLHPFFLNQWFRSRGSW